MKMKQWCAWGVACLLAVALLAIPVGAVEDNATDSMDTINKVYSLVMTETAGSISATPETPAFWEYPVLHAGEKFLVDGTMIVRNDGQTVASMVMEPVPIPYGDEAKLTYLDSLLLTVMEGDTVLYHNTYAHINDAEGGLALIYNDMAPGEEHTYTIRMECLFTYPGDVYQDAVPMSWRFSAKAETVTVEEEQKPVASWLWIVLITLVVIILAMIVIMIVQAVMRAKAAKAANPPEPESLPESDEAQEPANEELANFDAEAVFEAMPMVSEEAAAPEDGGETDEESEETAKKEEETVDNDEEV